MSATIEVSNPAVERYPQIARQLLIEHEAAFRGSQSISRQKIEQKDLTGSLRVTIPDFDYCLSSPIVDIFPGIQVGRVGITVAIDEGVLFRIFLRGSLSKSDGLFRIENTGLMIEGIRNRARGDFVKSTFSAMLGLAESVRLEIAELQLDLSLKLQLELSAISEILQRRLLAYRIMVIERAIGKEFELPSFITAENVKNIALIYHGVVHRSFMWPIGFVVYRWPATKEVLDWLLQINELPFIKLGPHPQSETLFGQLISLGEGFVTVHNKNIEDFENVIDELKRNDGHVVRVLIRSLTGSGAYEFPNAPRLPSSPWDSKIQNLIDLEAKLDARLFERYNQLAAASLTGLSEDEKAEITERPEIGEAFLLNATITEKV